jgi:hypothetical protein
MDEGRNMILLFPTLIHFSGEEERRRFEPRLVLLLSFITLVILGEDEEGGSEGGEGIGLF